MDFVCLSQQRVVPHAALGSGMQLGRWWVMS